MSHPEWFENIILGSGYGGKLLAWHTAGSGQRTAVIERRYIGGSCPNINCLPSKNEITGRVTVDMAMVRQRKREMVEHEIAGHLAKYKATGTELIMGSGRFVGPKTLEVSLNDGGTRVLTGDRVFLNVGTHPAIPGVPGLAAAEPLTNIEALELDYVPPHLVVLGGGYVGLELGQAYRRFGSRVTVVHQAPRLMEREDPDVSAEMQRTAPGVWDIGECAGSPQFTHVSVDDFRVIRDNLAGGKRSTRDRLVPYCMFTEPELAHVGLSEGDA